MVLDRLYDPSGGRGEIVVFNQQAELLFGYDRTEVLGKDLRVLLPASTHDAHEKHIKRFFARLQTREMGTGQDLLGVDRDQAGADRGARRWETLSCGRASRNRGQMQVESRSRLLSGSRAYVQACSYGSEILHG